MRKKQGISLIVLVITIIVMIILAASVVITLSNNGIIDKASQAVQLTDEKQVQDLAALIWAEAYLDEERTDTIENVVKERLKEQGITDTDWDIKVSDTGVTVVVKAKTTQYALNGVWKFKDNPNLNINIEQSVDFISYSNEYNKITVTADSANNEYYLEYYDNFGSEDAYRILGDEGAWPNAEEYKTIDLGTTSQEVSKEFYEWFTANATKQS